MSLLPPPRPINLAFAHVEILYGYIDGYASLPADLQEHQRNMVARSRARIVDKILPKLNTAERDIIEHALKCFDEDCAKIIGG